jgi:hypothetical protein
MSKINLNTVTVNTIPATPVAVGGTLLLYGVYNI